MYLFKFSDDLAQIQWHLVSFKAQWTQRCQHLCDSSYGLQHMKYVTLKLNSQDLEEALIHRSHFSMLGWWATTQQAGLPLVMVWFASHVDRTSSGWLDTTWKVIGVWDRFFKMFEIVITSSYKLYSDIQAGWVGGGWDGYMKWLFFQCVLPNK